ncbi:hypothetical protein acdb102_16080 [Acidothermaceae bacterium B102]|nr:hypothetical protein acdb102_16080 [Acidothermaceae bacterium B102]
MSIGPDEVAAISRAAAAGAALFGDPSAQGWDEPEGAEQCAAAVGALANGFAQAGGTVAKMIDNARAGAGSLSGDRLQALSEIVQNADDAQATEIRFEREPDYLVAVHNGRALNLRDVHALAAPWLTTKQGESSATGRFGVGLLTLSSLAPVFEIHSGDYHLRLGDPTVDFISTPESPYSFDPAATVLRVPLSPGSLASGELAAWFEEWDDSSLLFLRTVRAISYTDGPTQRTLSLTSKPLASRVGQVKGRSVEFQRRLMSATDGRVWSLHEVEVPSPAGLSRSHKRTEAVTPIGVALPLHRPRSSGQVFAGLPVARTRFLFSANGQLDPIASRQGFADSDWNRALAALIADVWLEAVVDAFASAPRSAWALVATTQEPAEPSSTAIRADLVRELEGEIVARATGLLPEAVRVMTEDGLVGLSDLGVESGELEGLLTTEEVALLAGTRFALPMACRDDEGSWRSVLTNWRHQSPTIQPEVDVAAAVQLLDREDRDLAVTLSLLAAAVRAGLSETLAVTRCLPLADGSRGVPPERAELRVLTFDVAGLGPDLRIATRLHPSLLVGDVDGAVVRDWLKNRHHLVGADEDELVLRLIASAGEGSQELSSPLDDRQAQALRSALEQVEQGKWQSLGAGIGKAIRLSATVFDSRGRRQITAARPADAYQPSAVDRDPDSFAVAAAGTPGIYWVAAKYATVLKSERGRTGLGAQRFLRLLGVDTVPKLRPHPGLYRRYAVGPMGLEASYPSSPRERAQALEALGAEFTLDDQHSPDLLAVLMDISQERKSQRRARAQALLGVLSRAWPGVAEFAEVDAASASGRWRIEGTVPASWVWSLRTVPWLDNAAGHPSAPQRLRRRTAATLAIQGDNPAVFLHPSFNSSRTEILASIGVTGEPDSQELLDKLVRLRSGRDESSDPVGEAALAYQALADRLSQGRRGGGHVSRDQLRRAFSSGEGLVRTRDGWRKPSQVLSGDPVFGNRRSFAPQVPGTEALWSALAVRSPTLADCLDVMRQIAAERKHDVEADTVALETLRLQARLLQAANGSVEPMLLARLRKMPLSTSQGWRVRRPVYVIQDADLAAAVGDRLPVWTPGGEVGQFDALVAHLNLVSISEENVTLVTRGQGYVDDKATELFRDAVSHLREDLARNAPVDAAAIKIHWHDLAKVLVRVVDQLHVSLAAITGKPDLVEVAARLDLLGANLFVTDSEAVSREDAAGRAVAALFRADQRRMAQAWLAAVSRAREGRRAAALTLASERAHQEGDEYAARLEDLRGQALQRKTEPGRASARPLSLRPPAAASGHVSGGLQSDVPRTGRTLVDIASLELVNPEGLLVRSSTLTNHHPDGPKVLDSASTSPLRPPRAVTEGRSERSERLPHREYTEHEKETLGLHLLRWVLGSDDERMVDLRSQRGVGADAVDELEQFYEFKVSGEGEPDEVRIEDSQVQRALSTPDKFFLVVVSGLEGPEASPTVRIITDPFRQLDTSRRSQLYMSGIRNSTSLVYRFTSMRPES